MYSSENLSVFSLHEIYTNFPLSRILFFVSYLVFNQLKYYQTFEHIHFLHLHHSISVHMRTIPESILNNLSGRLSASLELLTLMNRFQFFVATISTLILIFLCIHIILIFKTKEDVLIKLI